VDRYTGETCVALCAGEPVPHWVRERLDGLPETMRESTRRANQYERAVLDLVEAAVLADAVGETFDGVITDVDEKDSRDGDVALAEPAVEARVRSTSRPLPLGEQVRVRLVNADPEERKVRFELD
jgi:exoribonuclease R